VDVSVRVLDRDEVAVLDAVAADVFDGPVDRRWAAEFLADPRHHMAVAVAGGVVVGMGSGVHYVHPDKPPELWVNEVGVAPPYQNRAVGGVEDAEPFVLVSFTLGEGAGSDAEPGAAADGGCMEAFWSS
jgi:hypothetical protein